MTPSGAVERFVGRLRLRHRLWNAALAVGGQALLWGVVLLSIEAIAPWWLATAAWVAGLWLSVALLWALLRQRLSVAAADQQLGLGDRLLTYLGLRAHADPAFLEWLGADLALRLEALPESGVRRVWRRPLGRLRYLLPVLVLLLLLRFLAPLPPSLIGPGPSMAQGGGGGGTGQQGGGGGGAPQPQPQAPSPDSENQPAASEQQPSPQPPPHPEDQAPPQAPPDDGPHGDVPPDPILDLPPNDAFVVPQFIGEGPSRLQKAHQAVLDEGPVPRGAASAPGSAGGAPSPDAERATFRHAAEQAQRTRHVPPEERPFVRRYFERLLEPPK